MKAMCQTNDVSEIGLPQIFNCAMDTGLRSSNNPPRVKRLLVLTFCSHDPSANPHYERQVTLGDL